MEKLLRAKLKGGEFVDVDPLRSRTMSRIRGRHNRSTELKIRMALVKNCIRGWGMHFESLPGCPDFFFRRARLAIFVDGCFWHGCPVCGHIPKIRSAFWRLKIERNIERDKKAVAALRTQGIQVLRFWEHQVRDAMPAIMKRIINKLDSDLRPRKMRPYGATPTARTISRA